MALTNEIRLVGHCGAHPTTKVFGENRKILRLPIYTEHWSMVDVKGKRRKFKEIHWCVFFDGNAERASKLLMKGSQVHLCGTMHYHKAEKNGRTEVRPQVIVEEFTISSKATMTKELYDHIFKEDNSESYD